VVVVKFTCSTLIGLLLCVSTPRAEDRIEFFAAAVGYMNFLASGQALPCCEYHAVATASSPPVVGVVNCNSQTYRVASTRPAIINGNSNCPCESPLDSGDDVGTSEGAIPVTCQRED
jgi:hypothetical protein